MEHEQMENCLENALHKYENMQKIAEPKQLDGGVGQTRSKINCKSLINVKTRLRLWCIKSNFLLLDGISRNLFSSKIFPILEKSIFEYTREHGVKKYFFGLLVKNAVVSPNQFVLIGSFFYFSNNTSKWITYFVIKSGF